MRRYGLFLTIVLILQPGFAFGQATQQDADNALAEAEGYYTPASNFYRDSEADYGDEDSRFDDLTTRWNVWFANNPGASQSKKNTAAFHISEGSNYSSAADTWFAVANGNEYEAAAHLYSSGSQFRAAWWRYNQQDYDETINALNNNQNGVDSFYSRLAAVINATETANVATENLAENNDDFELFLDGIGA